jgi:hypothetical protein
MQLKREIREGVTSLMKGVTQLMGGYNHEEGEVAPLGAAPSSPIKVGHSSLSLRHLSPFFALLLHKLGDRLAKRYQNC